MMTAIERFIESFASRLTVLEYHESDDTAAEFSALLDDSTAVVYLKSYPPHKQNIIEVRLFAINPKLQKHGYGPLLLREITQWADSENVALYAKPELCDMSRFDFTADGYYALGEGEAIGKPYGNVLNNLEWGKYLVNKHGFNYTGDGLELRRLPRKSE